MDNISGKVILVTGGTGSWGNELVTQLLTKDPLKIIIYSRGEFAQVSMQRKFNDLRLKFIIGDVRDYTQLEFACQGVDTIFHLAALKHVPICQDYPYEAIKTNIVGTENLIKAAIKNKVKKVVDVSTDKAAKPLNLYGMTKAVGEQLILHANTLSNTEFVCIRAGNVLGSNGSVVPFFIDQIKRFNIIPITDRAMTRYIMTLKEAINLLLTAVGGYFPGALFVMKMPSCKISDIAKVLQLELGNKDTKIKIIGIRPGEKIHEVLLTEYESPNAYIYNENYYIVTPTSLGLPKVDFMEYSSNSQELLGLVEIGNILKDGGFLK